MTVHIKVTNEQARAIATLLYSGCSISALGQLDLANLSAKLNEEIGEFKFEETSYSTFTIPSGNYRIIDAWDAGDTYIDVT